MIDNIVNEIMTAINKEANLNYYNFVDNYNNYNIYQLLNSNLSNNNYQTIEEISNYYLDNKIYKQIACNHYNNILDKNYFEAKETIDYLLLIYLTSLINQVINNQNIYPTSIKDLKKYHNIKSHIINLNKTNKYNIENKLFKYPLSKIKKKSLFYDKQDNKCIYCNKELTNSYNRILTPTLEHIVPYTIVKEHRKYNLLVACSVCNHTRQAESLYKTVDNNSNTYLIKESLYYSLERTRNKRIINYINQELFYLKRLEALNYIKN